MEFEKLKSSSNKYDRLFFDTIEQVFLDLDLDQENKKNFYQTYLLKKQKKYTKQYNEIEGFEGPFRGKYLKGYAPQFKGKNFDTLSEVLEAFKKDDYAKGITLTRNGKYTIRRSDSLLNSKVNDNGSLEISWIIKDRKSLKAKIGGIFEIIKIKGEKYYQIKMGCRKRRL